MSGSFRRRPWAHTIFSNLLNQDDPPCTSHQAEIQSIISHLGKLKEENIRMHKVIADMVEHERQSEELNTHFEALKKRELSLMAKLGAVKARIEESDEKTGILRQELQHEIKLWNS